MLPILEKATFAGGCFWCMGAPFEELDGVHSVIAGYTGGHAKEPKYEDVRTGRTGHTESVQVTFDPDKITYTDLLDVYWKQIDPTDPGGQFVDRGSQYRPVIFYHDDEQKYLAEQSKKKLEESGRYPVPIAVKITKSSTFWEAEPFHQRYHAAHPEEYKKERETSGRDAYLKETWSE